MIYRRIRVVSWTRRGRKSRHNVIILESTCCLSVLTSVLTEKCNRIRSTLLSNPHTLESRKLKNSPPTWVVTQGRWRPGLSWNNERFLLFWKVMTMWNVLVLPQMKGPQMNHRWKVTTMQNVYHKWKVTTMQNVLVYLVLGFRGGWFSHPWKLSKSSGINLNQDQDTDSPTGNIWRRIR